MMEKRSFNDELKDAELCFGLAIFFFVVFLAAMFFLNYKLGYVPLMGHGIVFDGVWQIESGITFSNVFLIISSAINMSGMVFLFSAIILQLIKEKEARVGLWGFLLFIFSILILGIISVFKLGFISSLCSAFVLGFLALLILKRDRSTQLFGGLCIGGVFIFGSCIRFGFGPAFLSADLVFLVISLLSKLPQVKMKE